MRKTNSIPTKDILAYELGYWSTRAWGCLQSGWMMRDGKKIGTLNEALDKLLSVFESLGLDPTPIENAQRHIYSTQNSSTHISFSALWMALKDLWEGSVAGYGQALVKCCEYLAAHHSVPKAARSKVIPEIENSLRKLDSAHAREFRKTAKQAAEKEKAAGNLSSKQYHFIEDITNTLQVLEELIFADFHEVPSDPWEAEQWQGPKINYDERPGALQWFTRDDEDTRPLPQPMICAIKREGLVVYIENAWIAALYWNSSLDWKDSMEDAINYGVRRGRIEKNWFELGRDLALLLEIPAVPQSIKRSYFPNHYVEPPEPGDDLGRVWEETVREVDGVWTRAEDMVRQLSLLDLPEDMPSDSLEWAKRMRSQVENLIRDARRSEKRAQNILSVELSQKEGRIGLTESNPGVEAEKTYALEFPGKGSAPGKPFEPFARLLQKLCDDLDEGLETKEAGYLGYTEIFGDKTSKLSEAQKQHISTIRKELESKMDGILKLSTADKKNMTYRLEGKALDEEWTIKILAETVKKDDN